MAKKRRSKVARKKATRKKTARKKATRRGRPRGGSSLSKTTTDQLVRELNRRRETLSSEREALAERLAEVEADLAGLGDDTASSQRRGPGRPRKKAARKKVTRQKATGRRGRPRSGHSLADALERLLKNRTMGVSDAAVAVKKAGYKSKSANFRTIVNQALINNPDRFKKIARGQYKAK